MELFLKKASSFIWDFIFRRRGEQMSLSHNLFLLNMRCMEFKNIFEISEDCLSHPSYCPSSAGNFRNIFKFQKAQAGFEANSFVRPFRMAILFKRVYESRVFATSTIINDSKVSPTLISLNPSIVNPHSCPTMTSEASSWYLLRDFNLPV